MSQKNQKSQPLLAVGEILVSTDLVEEHFFCDIARCKGACCVKGDVGAPLEEEEKEILPEIYPLVKPYLPETGQKAIEEQGYWVKDATGSDSTPLVNNQECAYTSFDSKGVAHCGIEQAYQEGKIDFRKPISCHLYPARVHQSKNFEALHYDRWNICLPACLKGEIKGIRIYEFLKEALIRKYGEDFYRELDEIVQQRENFLDPNSEVEKPK